MAIPFRCDACGMCGGWPWNKHRCADGNVYALVRGYNGISEDALIHGKVKIGVDVSLCASVDVNGKDSLIEIGDACDIGAFVTINCADSHRRCIGLSTEIDRRPIYIEDHVFIGQGAIILGGTRIGHHSVIGAGVVLPKGSQIPAYSRVSSPLPIILPAYYSDDTKTSTYALLRKHRNDRDR